MDYRAKTSRRGACVLCHVELSDYLIDHVLHFVLHHNAQVGVVRVFIGTEEQLYEVTDQFAFWEHHEDTCPFCRESFGDEPPRQHLLRVHVFECLIACLRTFPWNMAAVYVYFKYPFYADGDHFIKINCGFRSEGVGIVNSYCSFDDRSRSTI